VTRAGRPTRVAGVVLAGGRSSRFGGDKLRAEIAGVPILHRAVTRVAEVVDDVIVVVPPGTDPADLPPGARIAHDEAPFEGPLAGLLAGLRAAGGAPRALAVGGDMPSLRPAVLAAMLVALEPPGTSAVVLHDGERRRPLPLAVRTGPALRAAAELVGSGERRLRRLLDELDATVLTPATWTPLDPSGATLLDVDEPGDLPEATGGGRGTPTR
jgi:molybdopterin-guanine dinucleotide biosynthesis protein A